MLEESPPARIAESAAFDVASELPGERIFSTSIGRGQAARRLWLERSHSYVTLFYLDQFQQRLAIADHQQERDLIGERDDRMSILCQSDLPETIFDLAIIPCSIRGEAELQRDLLQQAFARLSIGGRLVASVDNPRDQWLHEQMKPFAKKVTVHRFEGATVYHLTKESELKRSRCFDCDFAFRDRGQTIHAFSRPGVFSHRKLDLGAKTLLDFAEINERDRVIDIGCGCGSVSAALACRAKDVEVLAIDSHARAAQCAEQTAARNGIARFKAVLTCEGECDEPASYDVAVGNPPYYANFRIAQLFVDTAHRALRDGGSMFIVTKHPDWYQENLVLNWQSIETNHGKQYDVIRATK